MLSVICGDFCRCSRCAREEFLNEIAGSAAILVVVRVVLVAASILVIVSVDVIVVVGRAVVV